MCVCVWGGEETEHGISHHSERRGEEKEEGRKEEEVEEGVILGQALLEHGVIHHGEGDGRVRVCVWGGSAITVRGEGRRRRRRGGRLSYVCASF